MKTLIVYFSLEGNTAYAAKKIAGRLDADMLELEPVKPYPSKGAAKYLVGGMKASTHEAPELKPYQVETADYECIILGTPVWASNFAPPLRSFIRKHFIGDRKIGLFACSTSGNAEKCFASLRKEIGTDVICAELSLTDPLSKKKDTDEQKIEKFCAKLADE